MRRTEEEFIGAADEIIGLMKDSGMIRDAQTTAPHNSSQQQLTSASMSAGPLLEGLDDTAFTMEVPVDEHRELRRSKQVNIPYDKRGNGGGGFTVAS